MRETSMLPDSSKIEKKNKENVKYKIVRKRERKS